MYQPIILPYFKKELKQYAKKHRSLKDGVIKTLGQFRKKQHTFLGNNVYKIRLKVDGIPKGKNKSFRMVVLVVEIQKFIVPITIYFKGDKSDISKKELNNHLASILFELRSQNLLN